MESTRLVVEGWRGISQSFAMVNQHQLAWRQTAGLVARLRCVDGHPHAHDKYIYGGYHAGSR
ncbi:MAG: hypothetical protein H7Z19_13030 [Chitinophagaceae bacterium]|nr:hypothetical protein [Rubrivivax sp.]